MHEELDILVRRMWDLANLNSGDFDDSCGYLNERDLIWNTTV